MTASGSFRMVVGYGVRWRALRWKEGKTTEGWRDKSACPKRCKPLKRLAFCRAWRSVAGMKPGFCERFQRLGMHTPVAPRSRASS